MSSPDLTAFKHALAKAVTQHFAALTKALGSDRCDGYSLYTNDEVSSIGPVANRQSVHKAKPGEALYSYYRYSGDEWSEWDDFGLFREVNELIRQYSAAGDYFRDIAPKLLAVCLEVMAELKAGGSFAAGSDDLFLVVWVSDSSNSVMRESAARLNSAEAYRIFAKEFVGSE
jgi:hypothetical protein